MALNFGVITRVAVNIFSSKDNNDTSGESVISPLDARLPDVTLKEMRESGKSAARLRVEKGTGSFVDHIEVNVENRFGNGIERK